MVNTIAKKTALLIFSMAVVGMMFVGNSLVYAGETFGVKVAEKEGIGKYLTDGKGMALYRFANDTSGVSNCSGDCLVKWPAFYVEPGAGVEGSEASDFATITRNDGSQQTTYKGMPLYYFFNDKNPGDTNGQGVKDVWFVVMP